MNCCYQKKKERNLSKTLWSVLATLSRLEFRILTEPELLEKWELWTALHGGDGSTSVGVPWSRLNWIAIETYSSQGFGNALLIPRYGALEDKVDKEKNCDMFV